MSLSFDCLKIRNIYQFCKCFIVYFAFIRTFKDIQGHSPHPMYYLCIVIPEHTQTFNF